MAEIWLQTHDHSLVLDLELMEARDEAYEQACFTVGFDVVENYWPDFEAGPYPEDHPVPSAQDLQNFFDRATDPTLWEFLKASHETQEDARQERRYRMWQADHNYTYSMLALAAAKSIPDVQQYLEDTGHDKVNGYIWRQGLKLYYEANREDPHHAIGVPPMTEALACYKQQLTTQIEPEVVALDETRLEDLQPVDMTAHSVQDRDDLAEDIFRKVTNPQRHAAGVFELAQDNEDDEQLTGPTFSFNMEPDPVHVVRFDNDEGEPVLYYAFTIFYKPYAIGPISQDQDEVKQAFATVDRIVRDRRRSYYNLENLAKDV